MFPFGSSSKKGNNKRHAVADEAAHHRQTNMMARLRRMSFPARMSVIYAGSFLFGFALETFACKTGLYGAIVHNKTERRHSIDAAVVEFRENLDKWTKEDIRIAQEKEKALRLVEELKKASNEEEQKKAA